MINSIWIAKLFGTESIVNNSLPPYCIPNIFYRKIFMDKKKRKKIIKNKDILNLL